MADFPWFQQQKAVEKRLEPRHRVHLSGKVVCEDGVTAFDCTIRDLSKSGARITVAEGQLVPHTMYILDVGNKMAYEAMVAWKRPPSFGLKFQGTHYLPKLAKPQLRFLQRILSEFEQ